MNKYILFFILFSCLAWACGDDGGNLTPSGDERNWLVIEDNPGDPIDHQRYLIFKETGIPVYYNDTIGNEIRYSLAMGKEYMYYEVLQVFYVPGSITPGVKTANYELVKERENVKPVLDYLQNVILPEIPTEMYVPSILLVDSLTSSSGNLAYKGFNTIVVSEVSEFAEMDEVAKKKYRGAVLRSLVAGSLVGTEGEWLEENFYALTYEVNPGNLNYLYSTGTIGYAVYRACTGMDLKAEEQTLAVLGFIGTRTKPPVGQAERSWYVPERNQDVSQYCEAIFAYTEEEFKALHGEAPVVMSKYYVLRDKLKEYGFTFE